MPKSDRSMTPPPAVRRTCKVWGALLPITFCAFVIFEVWWIPTLPPPKNEDWAVPSTPVPRKARSWRMDSSKLMNVGNSSSDRRWRFPSFEQRLKIYTSSWYLPPCPNQTKTQFQFYPIEIYRGVRIKPPNSNGTVFSLKPELKAGRMMFLDADYMLKKNALEKNLPIERYFMEYLRNIELHWYELNAEENTELPLLLRFGDAIHPYIERSIANFPFLSKARPVIDAETLYRITSGTCSNLEQSGDYPYPILHLLGETRHLNPVYRIQRLDIPWENKKPLAVFRGTPTGTRYPDLNVSTLDYKIDFYLHGNNRISNPNEFCRYRPRCQFVQRYKDSKIIDARLMLEKGQQTYGYFEDSYSGEMTLEDLLKYRVIIVIEGNDVATSLKWALYSSSVVMMAEPTVSSRAMEELLVPWYHYVPLNRELTDAEEKMQWILDHEEEARKISDQGRLFIHDLMFHEDAREENERLKHEILRRMRAHFEVSPQPLLGQP